MGRRRERTGNSARRRRVPERRLRRLSRAERQRVYRRRRIMALAVLAAVVLVILVLAGLISLPLTGAKSSGVRAERESPNLDASPGAPEGASPGGADGAKPVKPAREKPSEKASGKPLDVLVLGVDRRPEGSSVEGSRTDTVMVARITPETGSVKMLSIPRDLFVEVEPGVEDRVNAAYSYGGVGQTTKTVERATGISVDRYAVVDFEGFKDIVDAVGGITVKIQGEMPPRRNMEGTQTLDGEQALFYARYRGTPGGDLDRIARQQQVVGALREKLVSWGTVSKLPGVMKAIQGNLETDLGLMANLSLARSLLNAGDANSAFATFQLAGDPTTLPDGRQVLVPDPAVNKQILQEFRED
ncbi:MAG: LCP family protein [Rubrobacteraceae bacterium]